MHAKVGQEKKRTCDQKVNFAENKREGAIYFATLDTELLETI